MHQSFFRRLQRKFSISAPRLAVRPYIPWYIRWAIALPFILATAGLVGWAYDSGLEFAGFHRGQAERDLADLRNELASLKTENARLASLAASYERQAQIEHAANMETARQLQGVNEENIRLKEDLTLFQNLTQSGMHEGELSIQHFKVERDTLPGEYRYRLLLVQSGGKRTKAFQGNLQLLINVQQNGEKSVVVLPQESSASTIPAGAGTEDAAYQLNFKYYQRIERGFQLPVDMVIESVQVRVFERGANEPKAKQSVNLP
ncbi:MAG: hypothetical protein Q7S51_01155 [Gallionellaceae bacterium]|nr:hypothetical protein [Gallionellaceae bacterium]